MKLNLIPVKIIAIVKLIIALHLISLRKNLQRDIITLIIQAKTKRE